MALMWCYCAPIKWQRLNDSSMQARNRLRSDHLKLNLLTTTTTAAAPGAATTDIALNCIIEVITCLVWLFDVVVPLSVKLKLNQQQKTFFLSTLSRDVTSLF